MIRSFRQPTNNNFTTCFGPNLKFYTSLGAGRGRGGGGTIELGGKTFSLTVPIKANPPPKKLKVEPGQFDDKVDKVDEVEERQHFETLSNPMRDPQELERQRYRFQQQRGRGGGIGGRGGGVGGRGGGVGRGVGRGVGGAGRFDNSGVGRGKNRIRNITENKNLEKPQAKDFISEDIDWYDFTISQMKNHSLNNQDDDEEVLKLESTGGDYERYVSIPNSIDEGETIMIQLEGIKNVIGQNSSYKLSDKKLFYETIAKTLKT
ncbi:hypothetical protein Glove_292g52 [Diversispora epigaea]|uniref:Uncharacterized protein n=1 Tax=Diversispora epigaea TaxID=1348612 RepID=A0A397I7W7_9GLOM|nr:hypothetical protein Glove_292g52 [Diversispora epigaea]